MGRTAHEAVDQRLRISTGQEKMVRMNGMAQTIGRCEGPYGEVVLRRRGECFEIIANGCFLMDSSDGRSERLLISAALDMLKQPPGASLLAALISG